MSESYGGRWVRLRLLMSVAMLVAACGGSDQAATGATPDGSAPVQPPVSSEPPPSTSAVLRWDAAADATGYRIYFGTAPGQYVQPAGEGIPAGDATTHVVDGLTSGTYYFAVTAVDAAGQESAFSNEAFKQLP